MGVCGRLVDPFDKTGLVKSRSSCCKIYPRCQHLVLGTVRGSPEKEALWVVNHNLSY